MSHDPAGTALLRRQAITPAAIAAVGVALGLYQATWLMLGPADERELALSLATPSSLDLSLPSPSGSQLLEVGQAVAGRVERGLASFVVLTKKPLLLGRIGVPTSPTVAATPAASAVPAPASVSGPCPLTAEGAVRRYHCGHAGGLRLAGSR